MTAPMHDSTVFARDGGEAGGFVGGFRVGGFRVGGFVRGFAYSRTDMLLH